MARYFLQVFFSILFGAMTLGQAGHYMEAIATAKGAAYQVFLITDRVKRNVIFCMYFLLIWILSSLGSFLLFKFCMTLASTFDDILFQLENLSCKFKIVFYYIVVNLSVRNTVELLHNRRLGAR